MPLRSPSTLPELIAFGLFAALALVGALATVGLRNPIRCAVGLFVHILALAGLYLTLGAQFLSVIQLLVYAGAVVVLFVFVIMLLGPAADPPRDSRGRVTLVISGIATAAVAAMILPTVSYLRAPLPSRPDGYGTLTQVGQYLYNEGMVPFELLGVTLVIAVVGAFAVARGHHRKGGPPPHIVEAAAAEKPVSGMPGELHAPPRMEGHS